MGSTACTVHSPPVCYNNKQKKKRSLPRIVFLNFLIETKGRYKLLFYAVTFVVSKMGNPYLPPPPQESTRYATVVEDAYHRQVTSVSFLHARAEASCAARPVRVSGDP